MSSITLANTRHSRITSLEEYRTKYEASVKDPAVFWAGEAKRSLHWFKSWDSPTLEANFSTIGESPSPYLSFFKGGETNVSYNCLDRHLDNQPDKLALVARSEKSERRTLSYRELHREVEQFAAALRSLGVNKGDAVALYLPVIPELVIAMLACARIGAIHSVIFSAFSSEALRGRINDCKARVLLTADVSYYGGKTLRLAESAQLACDGCPSIDSLVILNRQGTTLPAASTSYSIYDWQSLITSERLSATPLDAEAPLFILYTSGSTGKPKGVLHTAAGYLLYAHLSFEYVFDIQADDLYWCTADIGWITGHSYVVYGPLSNGATVFIYEGVPTYPGPEKLTQLIDEELLTILYTAPTLIRSLMAHGEQWCKAASLTSLRLLGSVGEPINPESWRWYFEQIGRGRCPIVDTWWQTETGGIMITTLPGIMPMKPGAAGLPFFGVTTHIDSSSEAPAAGGPLLLTKPWPGMLRGVFGDPSHQTIKQVYFSHTPGSYFTGDGCRIDEDGYHWLLGRIDDVINVAGHRLATAELESALVAHPLVAEAAVVAATHEIKGQSIICFVTPITEQYSQLSAEAAADLPKVLREHLRQAIGPLATPEKVVITPALPKTRSGKIMRRILRILVENCAENRAENLPDTVGDISTLADPTVVESIRQLLRSTS